MDTVLSLAPRLKLQRPIDDRIRQNNQIFLGYTQELQPVVIAEKHTGLVLYLET